MNLETLDTVSLTPSLSLLPPKFTSTKAKVMLGAIALQESALRYRHQIGGPAHGWWQFEMNGGTKGVMNHPSTGAYAHAICRVLGYPIEVAKVFDAIEHCDALSGAFARLLLWTLPQALPKTEEEAWGQYIDAWRPGKPHPEKWGVNWRKSLNYYDKDKTYGLD